MSTLTRETKETRIRVELELPGRAASRPAGSAAGAGVAITTDDGFLSHMLVTLARYAGWGLAVDATGDLRHHLVEDVAITLGTAAGRDTPATCVRYGEATVPMDEALVQVALDAGGRAHYEGELPSTLYDHFFRSFALNARWTVHVRVLCGRDRHHVVEAAFKALGLAVRQAMADDGAVFSTKGSVAMAWDDDLDEAAELGSRPGAAEDATRAPGAVDTGAAAAPAGTGGDDAR